MFIWVALKENVRLARILWIITEVCSNQGFLAGLQKNCQKQKPRWNLMPKRYLHCPTIWKVMQRNAWKDIANWRIKQLQQPHKVATPCMDDHQFREEENGSDGQLSTVCSQIVVKCLHLARTGRNDILWSVNKLARAVTKWTKAGDKRLTRLISYIHHTCEYRQYCYVGKTAQQCRLGLFQDSDFAGDLEDSKSTSGRILCIFGSHTFEPISWMCKKQTSVSHSSTEAEIISLDAGLRMNGIPALNLWNLMIEVFHSVPNRTDGPEREPWGNPSAVVRLKMRNSIPIKHTNVIPTNIDHIPSNTTHSGYSAMFQDNETVIKMIIKGRIPTVRHVSRTQRVALDFFFDMINLDPKIQVGYIDTKHQLADMLTNGNFTRDEWNNLLHLFNISHFSSLCCAQNFSLTSCPKTMAKRMQEQKEEDNRVVAKSMPTAMILVSSVPTKFFICERSDRVENPGDTQSIYVLNNIDCVPSNVLSSHQEALLYVFEDNEAVIQMIIKGRSPTMRHVSRTHRVALDWLFDTINLDCG